MIKARLTKVYLPLRYVELSVSQRLNVMMATHRNCGDCIGNERRELVSHPTDPGFATQICGVCGSRCHHVSLFPIDTTEAGVEVIAFPASGHYEFSNIRVGWLKQKGYLDD